MKSCLKSNSKMDSPWLKTKYHEFLQNLVYPYPAIQVSSNKKATLLLPKLVTTPIQDFWELGFSILMIHKHPIYGE